MTKIAAAGLVLIVVVELFAVAHPDRSPLVVMAGLVAAAALLGLRWLLARSGRVTVDDSRARDPAESLRRWLSKTEILVARADSTRSDWDKYLRPMLARQFELATGQRKSKDARLFHATAISLFGADLWPWIDPDNVSRTGAAEPGPGRAVLDDALRRLEGI